MNIYPDTSFWTALYVPFDVHYTLAAKAAPKLRGLNSRYALGGIVGGGDCARTHPR